METAYYRYPKLGMYCLHSLQVHPIGTRTFTVSPTLPGGNFSRASLVILKACASRFVFAIFLFSLILSRRLHIDGKRGGSSYIFSLGYPLAPLPSHFHSFLGSLLVLLHILRLLLHCPCFHKIFRHLQQLHW